MKSFYLFLLWPFPFIGYGQSGAGEVCKYEVKGIDGFTGEIFVEGEVLIAFVVFEIIFVLEGVPIADFRQAQLGNLPEYFTITLYTNNIMATRTVPTGTSDVLEFTVEGEPDCVFTIVITVVGRPTSSTAHTTYITSSTILNAEFTSSPAQTTEITSSTMQFTESISSTKQSTEFTSSTTQTTDITSSAAQTTDTTFSTLQTTEFTSSTAQTTELTPVSPYCHYVVEGFYGFAGEVVVRGEVLLASIIFQIVFLFNGTPITESRPAVLLNQPQYFTITLNTNEIMAKSKVPIGTTEDLTFTMEDAPECVFSLAITVINPLTVTSTAIHLTQTTDPLASTVQPTDVLSNGRILSSLIPGQTLFTGTSGSGKTLRSTPSDSSFKTLSTASPTTRPDKPSMTSQTYTTVSPTSPVGNTENNTWPASNMTFHDTSLRSLLLGLLSNFVCMYIISS